VKYQATKGLLESIGVPHAFAEPAAWIVAGYKGEFRPPSAAPSVMTAAGQAVPVAAGVSEAAEMQDLLNAGRSPDDAARIMDIRKAWRGAR
jgi:hypothetical protein